MRAGSTKKELLKVNEERTTQANQLTADDIRRTVRFKRPGNEVGPPIIVGQLMIIEKATYLRGNAPKQGYILTLGVRKRNGMLDTVAFGPVPADYEIHVGPVRHQLGKDPDDDRPDAMWGAWGGSSVN